MELINTLQELSKHPQGTFLDLLPFNTHSIGACDISGRSPVWEMHPDTDEFFHILEGQFEITLLEESGSRDYIVEAGSSFVVPKGIWHKPAAPAGCKFFYFTPGESLHSESEDPRH